MIAHVELLRWIWMVVLGRFFYCICDWSFVRLCLTDCINGELLAGLEVGLRQSAQVGVVKFR